MILFIFINWNIFQNYHFLLVKLSKIIKKTDRITTKKGNSGKIKIKVIMRSNLKNIETPYIDAQTLLNLLSDFRKPRDAILRMVKNGDLIRLKNGFYLISERIQQGIPYEQIANMLYGPSYVSMEWALSFYGMIPEKVTTVTSMTIVKDKEFNTLIGDFTYSKLSSECYSVGITQKKAVDSIGSFLMASPEKALVDLVYKSSKGLSKEQLKEDLLESRRMDREVLSRLNKDLLSQIGATFNSKSVKSLMDLIGVI